MSLVETFNRRFARLATNIVLRRPQAWRVLGRLVSLQFGKLAPRWDRIIGPEHLAPLEAALDAIEEPPRRILDVGTGTGAAALALAERWREAEVVGVDIAPQMIEEARRKVPPELAGRVRFEVVDAERLPFPDGAFDLVTLLNMIPFFDELARVLAPGGSAVFAFSGGAQTPIYVPFERLRSELEARNFSHFAEFSSGRGTALLARKPSAS